MSHDQCDATLSGGDTVSDKAIDLIKNMAMLQKADVPLDIINLALEHPYFLVQANCLLGLLQKLKEFPEYRTNDWIHKLDSILQSANAKIEIFGGGTLIHLALACIYEIKITQADDYFQIKISQLDEFDLDMIGKFTNFNF